jgi:hypothetical protein
MGGGLKVCNNSNDTKTNKRRGYAKSATIPKYIKGWTQSTQQDQKYPHLGDGGCCTGYTNEGLGVRRNTKCNIRGGYTKSATIPMLRQRRVLETGQQVEAEYEFPTPQQQEECNAHLSCVMWCVKISKDNKYQWVGRENKTRRDNMSVATTRQGGVTDCGDEEMRETTTTTWHRPYVLA